MRYVAMVSGAEKFCAIYHCAGRKAADILWHQGPISRLVGSFVCRQHKKYTIKGILHIWEICLYTSLSKSSMKRLMPFSCPCFKPNVVGLANTVSGSSYLTLNKGQICVPTPLKVTNYSFYIIFLTCVRTISWRATNS